MIMIRTKKKWITDDDRGVISIWRLGPSEDSSDHGCGDDSIFLETSAPSDVSELRLPFPQGVHLERLRFPS